MLSRSAVEAGLCTRMPSMPMPRYAGDEAKGAPKFPQERAQPDCEESWPNPCEPE